MIRIFVLLLTIAGMVGCAQTITDVTSVTRAAVEIDTHDALTRVGKIDFATQAERDRYEQAVDNISIRDTQVRGMLPTDLTKEGVSQAAYELLVNNFQFTIAVESLRDSVHELKLLSQPYLDDLSVEDQHILRAYYGYAEDAYRSYQSLNQRPTVVTDPDLSAALDLALLILKVSEAR